MKTQTENPPSSTELKSIQEPEGFENGLSVEHILIKVDVIHTNRIIQYDDSCAHILDKALRGYKGVMGLRVEALYDHCKTDVHANECDCHWCQIGKKERINP